MTSDASGRIEVRAGVPAPGEAWTVMGLILWSAAYLTERGVPSGRLDAEHLLADTLGVDRLHLYLNFDRPMEALELAAFKPRLLRRASREPLQYILGRTAFRELELLTDPRALIPRPETEELVSLVLGRSMPADRALVALDLGTGSGAIALSLLAEGPFDRVVATDVSRDALALARENAVRTGLLERVDLRHGALWEPLGSDERFDVIVSNPPYVEDDAMAGLQPEIHAWEPRDSLRAGTEGLDVLRPLLNGAPRHLRPGGLLAVEIGADQATRVLELVSGVPGLVDPVLEKDLAGRNRFVCMHAPGGAERS